MMVDHLARARLLIRAQGLTPADTTERCPGCAAPVPAVPGGPVHRFINASAGCWAIYAALLSSEFGAFDARTHQLSVNSYAAQHPGDRSPRQIQSVCTHLVALCLSLEHGFGVEALRPMVGDLNRGRWFEPRWLEPPAASFGMTVVDLLDAETPEAYGALVREWASATWDAWLAHHAQVREWTLSVLADPGDLSSRP
jgi:hypothetical protein